VFVVPYRSWRWHALPYVLLVRFAGSAGSNGLAVMPCFWLVLKQQLVLLTYYIVNSVCSAVMVIIADFVSPPLPRFILPTWTGLFCNYLCHRLRWTVPVYMFLAV
jgi:hypothetical protein